MDCREGCGACCSAPSISEPLPGMPAGKPAGVACVNLDPESRRCLIWETADYPALCRRFQPAPDVCGTSRQEALRLIGDLERDTRP